MDKEGTSISKKQGTSISQNQTPQLSSLLHLEKFYTLGLMTHRIAHEMNNSIQGMLLVLSFLETDYSSDENIALLTQEVHEMKRMIRSIQSLLKANNLEFESIDFSVVIRETITLLNDLTGDPVFAGIGVQYPPSDLLPVKGNFFCLQLALLNLLLFIGQSADRHNPSQIKIEVSTDPSAHMHTIRIHCCGQLALDKSNNIINLSEYAGEARFSLVQRAISVHQGTFQALDEHDGEHDGGLCFIITLPTLPIPGC